MVGQVVNGFDVEASGGGEDVWGVCGVGIVESEGAWPRVWGGVVVVDCGGFWRLLLLTWQPVSVHEHIDLPLQLLPLTLLLLLVVPVELPLFALLPLPVLLLFTLLLLLLLLRLVLPPLPPRLQLHRHSRSV